MSKLLVKDKDIIVPGQVVAEGMDYLPSHGTYRKDDRIIADRLALVMIDGKVIKSLPLTGAYVPKRNDVVIGRVMDILMSGWRIDINSAYSAVLPLQDASFDYIKKGDNLTRYFDLDDYVVTKITNVTSQKLVDVSMKAPGLKKLQGGRIIKVNTHKVPRIIGKQGTMVSMIKDATGCRITVGQNGLIWLNGEPEQEILAVKAIRKVEDEAHIQGLTDRIKDFLDKNKISMKEEKVEEKQDKDEQLKEENVEQKQDKGEQNEL
ncbi:MAG: exosome complex RNA-binding protein Rrp4 [Nanoarchaeota archaeon]|nr:exosome complex protein Rrp4 [Nanoarchaeota archaeon]MBU1029766.1 exosome complex protein Rrp4 [Nanoarchaeota archaeon]